MALYVVTGCLPLTETTTHETARNAWMQTLTKTPNRWSVPFMGSRCWIPLLWHCAVGVFLLRYRAVGVDMRLFCGVTVSAQRDLN